MRERDQSLDILRGIGIFLMVFDHVGWGSVVHTYIQSFHMPLFFIVSGYLWKNEELSSLVKKRFRTLIVPYAIFAIVFLVLQRIPLLNEGKTFLNSAKAVLLYPSDMGNMPIAPALWFLPCMFWTTIAYSLLSRLDIKVKTVCTVAITAVGMTFSALSDRMLPFTIEPLMVALGFMLVGELIKQNQDKVMNLLNKPWIIVGLLISEAALAMVNRSVDLRSARYNNCIFYIFNSIAGTMAYWGLSRRINAISAKIPWGGVQRLSFLSQNSMGFICMNQFFIMLLIKAVQSFLPSGVLAMVLGKSVVFVVVMIVVSWVTHIIMRSQFRIILGGK